MISRREAMQAAVAASAVAIVPAPAGEVSDEEWTLLEVCAADRPVNQVHFDRESPIVVIAEKLHARGWVRYVELGYEMDTADGNFITSYYTATEAGQQALRERAS